jgi:hypothetical protein
LIQGLRHLLQRLVTVLAVGNQLGNHRIVINGNFGAFLNTRVDANALHFGFDVAIQTTDRRKETPVWEKKKEREWK